MAELRQLKQDLLDCLAPQRPFQVCWTPEQWIQVLKMARQHRLLPLLHWRLLHDRPAVSVPEAVRQRLAQAFKRATLEALAWQRELLVVQAHLTQAGIPCLALKGAYLAVHSYPHPALRPLRDLDLLLPMRQVVAAQQLLLQQGYRAVTPGNWEACLATRQHLPMLEAPESRQKIELHFRLHALTMRQTQVRVWEQLHAQALTVSLAGQPVAYLAPTELLLHLIAHSVYQHRFDNGPLLLSDIAYLLQQVRPDWDGFWQEAERRRWSKGCVLVLYLVTHYYPALDIPYPAAVQQHLPAARAWVSVCGELMLGDLRHHADLHLASELAGRSWAGRSWYLLRRLLPAPREVAQGYTTAAQHSPQVLGGYWYRYQVLLTRRLPRLLCLRQTGVAAAARQVAALEHWLLK